MSNSQHDDHQQQHTSERISLLERVAAVAERCAERVHGPAGDPATHLPQRPRNRSTPRWARERQRGRYRIPDDPNGLSQVLWLRAQRKAYLGVGRGPMVAMARAHRRWRTGRAVARASRKTAWRTARFGIKTATFAVRRPGAALLVILILWIFGIVSPAQLWGGAKGGVSALGKIMPSAYGCADPQPQPLGGIRGAAFRTGATVRTIGQWSDVPPDKRLQQIHDALISGAEMLGESFGYLQGALKGTVAEPMVEAPVPAPPPDSPYSKVGSTGGCCSSGPVGGGVETLPASLPSDTPAVVAARAAQAAGWTGTALVEAVAVAGAESGWDPTARNPSSTARGMWQVMLSYHQTKFQGADWRDPTANARVAKMIYDAAGGWSPWAVWTSNAYQAYMARAQQAVAQASGTMGPFKVTTLPVSASVATLARTAAQIPGPCFAPTSGGAPLPDLGLCPATGLSVERGLLPDALLTLRCVREAYPSLTQFAGVGERPNPTDHTRGAAVDAMIPDWQDAGGVVLGNSVAAFVRAHASALGVTYVIWRDQIWSVDRDAEGWRPYEHPTGPTTDPTLRHLDHVHISVDGFASAGRVA